MRYRLLAFSSFVVAFGLFATACGSGQSEEDKKRAAQLASDLVSCKNEVSTLKEQLAEAQALAKKAQGELANATTKQLDPIDVRRVLDACGDQERELLERHYIEGYTAEEIGSSIGLTAAGIRVRLLRLRRVLRHRLFTQMRELAEAA